MDLKKQISSPSLKQLLILQHNRLKEPKKMKSILEQDLVTILQH